MNDVINKIVERCRAAGVTSVYAATHHGMGFLLSKAGAQIDGIVFRDDDMPEAERKTLAQRVNSALHDQLEALPSVDTSSLGKIEIRLLLEGGKYEYRFYEKGGQECLRYGIPWRQLTGDNLILAMANKIQEQQELIDEAAKCFYDPQHMKPNTWGASVATALFEASTKP